MLKIGAKIMNADVRACVKSSILWSNSTCHGQTSALTADEPTITWESSSREQAILLERKKKIGIVAAINTIMYHWPTLI
jgi:hypothetical protein